MYFLRFFLQIEFVNKLEKDVGLAIHLSGGKRATSFFLPENRTKNQWERKANNTRVILGSHSNFHTNQNECLQAFEFFKFFKFFRKNSIPMYNTFNLIH